MSFSRVDSDGNPVLNIRSIVSGSVANGPGSRLVVWFQGCGHGCVGCYNPGSWSGADHTLMTCSELIDTILSSGCTGVTFTGGEPMSQPAGFFEVLRGLQSRSGVLDARLSDGIILFTGHTLQEIAADYHCAEALSLVDVAIIGRFVREQRAVRGLIGSTNQLVWWNPLAGRGRDIISESSILEDQTFEMHPVAGGVLLTGFPDVEKISIPGLVRKKSL